MLRKKVYTVSFIGQDDLDKPHETVEWLDIILRHFIFSNPRVHFLVSHDNKFDILAASSVRRANRYCRMNNTELTLVKPYRRADFNDIDESLFFYFDSVEEFWLSELEDSEAAFLIRNQSMIDRADIVVFYVDRKNGDAYRALQYARSIGREFVNVIGDNI